MTSDRESRRDWGRSHRDVGGRLPTAIVMMIVSMILLLAHVNAGEPRPTAIETKVRLVIDYGDGVQKHFTGLHWHQGATVFEILQAAARHPRGIRVKHRGRGATVMVTQIDNVVNQAGADRGRNWIFRVNDEVGDRSAGILPIEAGDTILWSFETYR